MFHFYVLYSLKDHKLYKGYSSNAAARFAYHQAGGNKSTKNRRPLVLIYVEVFPTKQEAMQRERWAKSAEGGPQLKALLQEMGILGSQFRLNGL